MQINIVKIIYSRMEARLSDPNPNPSGRSNIPLFLKRATCAYLFVQNRSKTAMSILIM